MKTIDKKHLNEMHKLNAKCSHEFSGRKKIDTAILCVNGDEIYFLRTVKSKVDGYRYNVITYYMGEGKYYTEIRKVQGL